MYPVCPLQTEREKSACSRRENDIQGYDGQNPSDIRRLRLPTNPAGFVYHAAV